MQARKRCRSDVVWCKITKISTSWSLTPEMARTCRDSGSKGAPGNAVDSNGETAMHDGAYKTMPSVVKCVDSYDADIKIWSKPTMNGGHLS